MWIQVYIHKGKMAWHSTTQYSKLNLLLQEAYFSMANNLDLNILFYKFHSHMADRKIRKNLVHKEDSILNHVIQRDYRVKLSFPLPLY